MNVVNGKNKAITLLLAVMILIAFLPIFAVNTLAYEHDPAENPAAMKDIVRDENAVYGFRPSETGSLKMYADADWSDPEIVEKGRQERIAYHESIESMYDMMREMKNEGKTVEEIARAVSAKRNELRFESYKDDPDGLAALKERNLEKYGHEEGPLPDELFDQYGSWERVIEKAFSANVGMDACLGLYDDYYDLYVLLGQVGDDEAKDTELTIPDEEDTFVTDATEEETAIHVQPEFADGAVQGTEQPIPDEGTDAREENAASAAEPDSDVGHVTPETGNGSRTAIWIAVTAASGAALAVSVILFKRHSEKGIA